MENLLGLSRRLHAVYRLSVKRMAQRDCVQHWRWWAAARHLRVSRDIGLSPGTEMISLRQPQADLATICRIEPYHAISCWSHLCRSVCLCGDTQNASAAILVTRSLMRMFKAADHSHIFTDFMHKFHIENKAMSIFGWREAFSGVDPEVFHLAAVKAVSCWPTSLLVFFLSIIQDLS